ncbi:helix-turn-helix domain-containing protein [Streptomyces sp. NPDC058869]|uniref:helix-turn-helix domain-containing protein n=1 Tax=Streptomyces sp. NPDC058869 TaxID=3346659 RepID=UPI0036BDF60A
MGVAGSPAGRSGVVSGGRWPACAHVRYAFRIDPAPGQSIAQARTFGCTRVVCNDGRLPPGRRWAGGRVEDRGRSPGGAGGQRREANARAGVARWRWKPEPTRTSIT